jgi:hypothetical protein
VTERTSRPGQEYVGAADEPGSAATTVDTHERGGWPPAPTEIQLVRRRVLVKKTRVTTAAMGDLAEDLLSGHTDQIPAGGLAWIEDMLTGRRVTPIGATDFVFACWWAQHGWPVFPQRSNKSPRIPSPHPKGSPERLRCKGRCGQDGHGHLDATTDLARIRGWGQQYGLHWGGIGARVPQGVISLDIDPRHGGDESLAALQEKHRPLPPTQETISGRGDGGRHLFFRVPAAMKLTGYRLVGTGIDLKTSSGAVRVPPSIHEDTLRPYLLVSRPVAAAPDWLLRLLRPEPGIDRKVRARQQGEELIADEYSGITKWTDLLTEHNWVCLDDDGDTDGAHWRHPDATAPWSASISHGLLFVYSTNTDFEPTSYGDPHGYTKFRAYAVLEHNSDMTAAARALRAEKEAGL